MDNLRLILILIGIVVLALIVLMHKPAGETQRNHTRWRGTRREPSLGGADSDSDEAASGEAQPEPEMADLWVDADHDTAHRAYETHSAEDGKPASPDKIVYLYVCRRGARSINGSDLLDAAIKAGLNFGEMNIFHRRQEGVRQPVFSMANLTNPGHFDPGAWNVFETPGVTLFLTLPAPLSALDAWDAMLATAQRISELLEADLLDDNQCLLTRQRIAQLREEMREYDRRTGMLRGA